MTPHRIAALPLLVAVGLLPWAAYLALSLPSSHTAVHWSLAWTGFDLALAGSFAATGWAALRRPALLPPILLACATLMTCDSWFDVTTALGTPDQAVALLEAAMELPLALAAAVIAVRLASRRPAGGSARARPRSRARSRCSDPGRRPARGGPSA
jgi:hypothetical protein